MPVTLFWILFATNAMNFIDGLNGLASGVSVIACAALAVIAASLGGWFVYFASLLLAAGLLGFLPFNFPRARIFMGDVGSQFCGFVLAVLAVVAGRFEGVELSALLVPMLLFGVLFDVAFTLLRRAACRRRDYPAASQPPVSTRAPRRDAGGRGDAGPLGVRAVGGGVLRRVPGRQRTWPSHWPCCSCCRRN